MGNCVTRETVTTTQKTEKYSSTSQEVVEETVLTAQGNIEMETESKEIETFTNSSNGCIDDEELLETLPEKKKISLLGEQYSDSERTETAEKEEEVGISDIVKNVDGPTRQRKGRPKLCKKERSKSESPIGG